MHRTDIAYRLLPEHGLEFVLCREQPKEYPWHFHLRHWTFGLALSGSVALSALRNDYQIAAGQTFAIAPLSPHRLRIHERSLIAVLCSEKERIAASARSRLLVNLEAAGIRGENVHDWLAAPLKRSDAVIRPLPLDKSSPIKAACRLLAERAEDPLPLEALARFAGCSPWHFLRLFKKETGFTPHAFQRICRLSLARELLRTTTAADAAAASGFADQSHLHKFFTLHHSLTPRQFVEATAIFER